MLPNLRLSGSSNSITDSMSDFLGVSAMAARSSVQNISNKTGAMTASSRAPGSSGWGTHNKTLADYVKDSPAWPASVTTSSTSSTTSMPWAAAVSKSPPDQHSANSFDYTNTIGSWNSPETSSSGRSGWNANGSSKADGVLDDGTAIWGNPSTKKTGVDWTDKETITNPPQKDSNSEKRIQKAEPTVSSLNGTEAWGAPVNKSSTNNQQQLKNNDNNGNTYVTKPANSNSLKWGESSSHSSSLQVNENSSPPNNSAWNNMGINKQKSSDWLSGSVVGSGSNISTSTRLDELNKQFESTSLFDPVASMNKSVPNNNNPNLERHSMTIGGIGSSGTIGTLGGANTINDLKQMSANYHNDLLDSPNRGLTGLSSSNNQSQQLDSSAYSSATSPSRDLLKQIFHQINLAVQAGHLNAHIMNQPMSTSTLQLVYQLLQQIRTLHQLQEIQQRAGLKSDINSPTNMDIQIDRIRQNISLLQKTITQQQAALINNENLSDSNIKQQQANNQSYATISKLSTNLKVPSNMSNIINNSNQDSFRRSNFIDTLSNSNSDSLRSTQASFENSNATIDKTLSSFIQASSANNILGSNKTITTSGDFAKAQAFTAQQSNKGLLSAQSSSAWGGLSQPAWSGQSRISSNVSQDESNQFSAFDMVPEFSRAWRDGSSVLSDAKDNSNMAPGGNMNIARPNSASNTLKQMNETDILNRDSSLFCDWGNNSDSAKRNFDQAISNASSSFSSSAIGGLSLQSNPWMFASTALNMGCGVDNTKNNSGNLHISNKMDNGNTDKLAGDSIFPKPGNTGNLQRSSSGLYDWIDGGSSSSSQMGSSENQMNKQQSSGTGRPAPPPGLMSNFGSLMSGNSTTSASANGASILHSKLANTSEEVQLQSRESASNLWSGTWFD